MPALPADQRFHNPMSDDKNTVQTQTEAVLRARQLWLELPKGLEHPLGAHGDSAKGTNISSPLCSSPPQRTALLIRISFLWVFQFLCIHTPQ